MNVFEAKSIAEAEFNKFKGDCVSTGFHFIVVSDKEQQGMIVPDYNTALKCGCKWIFKARRNNGCTIVELCELH